MKKILIASLLSIVAVVNFGMFAMDVNPALSVEIANQTDSDITIIDDENLITVPSYSDKNIRLKSTFPQGTTIGAHRNPQHTVTISTVKGDYELKWAFLGGEYQIQKGYGMLLLQGANGSRLARPRNPIIIFEEDKDLPTIREHEDQ